MESRVCTLRLFRSGKLPFNVQHAKVSPKVRRSLAMIKATIFVAVLDFLEKFWPLRIDASQLSLIPLQYKRNDI